MPGTTNVEKVESPKDNAKTSSDASEHTTENVSLSPDKKSAGDHSEGADREKLITEAGTLLAQGKRHLFVKDYPSAVAALGDACGKLSEIYGELACECSEAYFNYGCALLELAREESTVLDVDNKDKDSEESEEGNDDETNVADGVKKEDHSADKTDENNVESKTDDQNVESKTDENEPEGSSEVKDKDNEDADDDDDEEEEEDDVNNLQLAWEIFELAKRSFEQQNDEIKLAETYLKLGEVALESENYDGAITDIRQCLDLQKKILPPVSREIAETHFQLGVACSLSNQFDEAIKHFTSAGELLESRIQNLSEMTKPEPEKAKNPFYSISNEIEEIKALLPEIKEKIVDMEEFKKETMKVVQATFGISSVKETSDGAGPSTNGTSSSGSASAASKGPANDISHLIRKKRKPDDNSESEPKKQHLETKTA